MRQEIVDAIEAAAAADYSGSTRIGRAGVPSARQEAHVHRVVLAFVQSLPEDMTVLELRTELEE